MNLLYDLLCDHPTLFFTGVVFSCIMFCVGMAHTVSNERKGAYSFCASKGGKLMEYSNRLVLCEDRNRRIILDFDTIPSSVYYGK